MEEIWDPLAPKVPSIARGMRILLVDSDTTSLMFMASILESHSYKGKAKNYMNLFLLFSDYLHSSAFNLLELF